jgi:hypothetical protein
MGYASLHPWKIGLVWLLTATGSPAGEIYKSFDANGNVVYSDHADPSNSQSALVTLEDPRYPPHEMHVCGTQNCFTLVLDNGRYRRADGTDESWTIGTFTAKSVVLHRHGAATADTEVTYSGDVANDRLINVTENGKPGAGLDASWGIALNTLPGSNAERDADRAASTNAPADSAMTSATTPPPLPPENQTAIPDPGYLWTPGYWYWRDQGYFWVPGAWVQPPRAGVLWTPAFWAAAGTVFVFHPGHWGPTVGPYGGINYGYGYYGSGYTGGRWVGNSFVYNSSVNHLTGAITNTYTEPPPSRGSRSLASYKAMQPANMAASGQPTAVMPARSAANPQTRATIVAIGERAPLRTGRASVRASKGPAAKK